jgi:hypothetical protein
MVFMFDFFKEATRITCTPCMEWGRAANLSHRRLLRMFPHKVTRWHIQILYGSLQTRSSGSPGSMLGRRDPYSVSMGSAIVCIQSNLVSSPPLVQREILARGEVTKTRPKYLGEIRSQWKLGETRAKEVWLYYLRCARFFWGQSVSSLRYDRFSRLCLQ